MTKYNSDKDLSLDEIFSSIRQIIAEEKTTYDENEFSEVNKKKFNQEVTKKKVSGDHLGDILELTEVVNIGLQNKKNIVPDTNLETNKNDSVPKILTVTPTLLGRENGTPVENRIQQILKNLKRKEYKFLKKLTKEERKQIEQIIINCAQIIIKEYLDEKLSGIIEGIKKVELNNSSSF